jgi:hypothetical protein
VIWRPQFIPYKKAYYRYKLLPKEEVDVEEPDQDLSQPGAKKARLDTEDDPSWIHFDFFKQINEEDFQFNNEWINEKSTLASGNIQRDNSNSGFLFVPNNLMKSEKQILSVHSTKLNNSFCKLKGHSLSRLLLPPIRLLTAIR